MEREESRHVFRQPELADDVRRDRYAGRFFNQKRGVIIRRNRIASHRGDQQGEDTNPDHTFASSPAFSFSPKVHISCLIISGLRSISRTLIV